MAGIHQKEKPRQMKKLVTVCILLFLSNTIHAQVNGNSLLPYVDKRVELLSIVFRLADGTKINDTLNPVYSKAIQDHFKKHSDHPLIHYIKKIMDSLRQDSIELGDWDIANIAVHLSQPPMLQLLPPIKKGTDDVWESKAFLNSKLVPLIQQFYTAADCEGFFSTQENYYRSVSLHYTKGKIIIDKGWLTNFFNLPLTEEYFAIIGLNMTSGAYLRANLEDRKRQTFTIFACTSFDKNGIPVNITDAILERNILHEYIHAYTNQLVDNNKNALQKAAETLLNDTTVMARVQSTFYNNREYLLYESLVRACTILYRKNIERDSFNEEKEIHAQEKAGFLWMKALVNELANYQANRPAYNNLSSFMPQIISFFKRTARL